MRSSKGSFAFWLSLYGMLCALAVQGESFRVATYNVENYLEQSTKSRPAKPAEAKAKIRESIRALGADVVALEEIGSEGALQELRSSLKNEAVDFPYWEIVSGFDTNIHVAILSKFPLVARRPHTTDDFLLNGRRFRLSRGFAEVDIRVNPDYSFTLIAAHLKSKRTVGMADEAELRFEEAKVLRGIIDARLAENPATNLVVLGDLNDTKDAPSTKAIIGKGKNKLVDTRPAERNANLTSSEGTGDRSVAWTHYFAKEDSYSRIDYILLSPGMAREWVSEGTYVLSMPGWDVASDHRPLVATFTSEEK